MNSDVGSDGAIWRNRGTLLFRRGLYYFEDSITELVERISRDAKAAAARRLPFDPRFTKKV